CTLPRPLTAQELALSRAPPERDWVFVPAEEANQCGAWNGLLAAMLIGTARPPLASNWGRNPGGRKGFMAPWAWPPRKDGSHSAAEDARERAIGPPSVSSGDEEFMRTQGLG